MNHYERLKVSPDAPPEVIRAAYRALAAKLHPDRKPGDSGPGDPMHDDMAALNASYLILMDSKARADYDQTLVEQSLQDATSREAEGSVLSRWGRRRDAANPERTGVTQPGQPVQAEHADTQVNVDWLTSMPAPSVPWHRQPKVMTGVLLLAALFIGGLAWWGMQQAERLQFDRSLSSGAQPQAVQRALEPLTDQKAQVEAAVAAASSASVPVLSKEQLARMSDSELLATMPQLLDGKKAVDKPAGAVAEPEQAAAEAVPRQAATQAPPPPLAAPKGPHMLDGQPLGLKMAPMTLPPNRH